MRRKITCIVCPRGCTLQAEISGDNIKVTGHACPRGEKHAIAEIQNPVRSLTSIVRVNNREDAMVSVKTLDPVPKGKLFEIMYIIRNISVSAPIALGDVILDDVFGTQIVATKSVM